MACGATGATPPTGVAPVPCLGSREDSGGYDCEFLEPPPAALQTECPICLQILKQPCVISCPCGQKICRECVERIERDKKPCPLCNKTNFTFIRDYGLERALKEFDVQCFSKKDGCGWRGKLGEYEQHLNRNPSPENQLTGCQFVAVECAHECGKWFQRRHIASHQNQHCTKRPYFCEYCQKFGATYKYVTTCHYYECDDFPVTCPNKCRKDPFRRHALYKHVKDECLLEEIDCPLHDAGCEVRLPRKDMPEHMTDTVTHLTLLATVTQNLFRENQELRQTVEKRDSIVDKLMKENQRLGQKMKDREFKVSAVNQSLQSHKSEIQNLKDEVQRLKFHKLGLPCDFRIEDNDGDVFLPGFYTHSSGYRMCIRVVPRGLGKGKGTHISLFVYLQKGQFDDHLKWPFRGEIAIQIVNQAGDHDHFRNSVIYNDVTVDASGNRVVDGKRSQGWGYNQFFSRSDLQYNPKKNTQYLKNDIVIVRLANVTLL